MHPGELAALKLFEPSILIAKTEWPKYSKHRLADKNIYHGRKTTCGNY